MLILWMKFENESAPNFRIDETLYKIFFLFLKSIK